MLFRARPWLTFAEIEPSLGIHQIQHHNQPLHEHFPVQQSNWIQHQNEWIGLSGEIYLFIKMTRTAGVWLAIERVHLFQAHNHMNEMRNSD